VRQEEEEDRIVKTQDLSNLIAQDKLLPAARLAIEIGHPYKLLIVITKLLQRDDATELLHELVAGLEPEAVEKLLGYVQDWNTNSKRCHTAHAVLGAILRSVPAEQLTRLPTTASVVQSLLA
jgi:U3 small nucleolar RNA-associated protein 13